jgi:tRNA threonylcarbamoyladenosine biosynthesis protein TsaB
MSIHPTYLVVYGGYTSIELAIFKGETSLDRVEEENKQSSKNFIPLLNNLLINNRLSLSDLSFIAVYQGPAPLTTLRVIISSVNGLAYAIKVPLIGINGLTSILDEYHGTTNNSITISLLNAFCKNIYFGIYNGITHKSTQGCNSSQIVFDHIKTLLQTHPSAHLVCIGNAVPLYYDELKSLSERIIIPTPLPLITSLNFLALQSLKSWRENATGSSHLLPLYLGEYTTLNNARSFSI